MYLKCDTRSPYYLPLRNLSRRLDKGPYQLASVDNIRDHTIVFRAGGLPSTFNLTTNLSAPLLYEHRAETLALAIERNLHSQVEERELLLEKMEKRRPRKRSKAIFK